MNALFCVSHAADSCGKWSEQPDFYKGHGKYPSVKIAPYKFELGGDGEEYIGSIDRKIVRARFADCMPGMAECLKKSPQKINSGKLRFIFDIIDQPDKSKPNVENFKIESKDFTSKEFTDCLKNYWTNVRHISPQVKGAIAEVQMPVTISEDSKK